MHAIYVSGCALSIETRIALIITILKSYSFQLLFLFIIISKDIVLIDEHIIELKYLPTFDRNPSTGKGFNSVAIVNLSRLIPQ